MSDGGATETAFVLLVTAIFIALKIANYIDWSWWCVLSPLWIGALIVLLLSVLTILLMKWE